MRIHRLTFRGIGPFRDEFTIDFDELGRSGLFLLDGPTGVGKSTIIDAIVFALYGTPAADDAKDRVVSDFLTDITSATRPFVDLVFSTSAGVFRVRRQPGYERTTRAGTLAKAQSTVLVERLVNESEGEATGELLSNKAREADLEIRQHTGLDRTQFLSTIVLAQGDFARFLRAKPDERRAILQKVFHTGLFDRIGALAVDVRRSALQQRSAAVDRVKQRVVAVCEALGDADNLEQWTDRVSSEPDAVRDDVAIAEADLAAQIEQDRATAACTEKRLAAARGALADMQDRVRRRDTKRGLVAEERNLQGGSERIEGIRRAHDRAETAETLRTGLADVDDAVRKRDDLAAGVARLRGTLDPLDRDLLPQEFSDRLNEILGDRAGLEALLELERGIGRREQDLLALAGLLQRSESELAKVDEDVGTLPGRRQELQDRRQELQRCADQLDAARASLDAARSDQGKAAQLARAESDLAACERDLTTAVAAMKAADDHSAQLRRRYMAGIAAELAADLDDGEPCPVCGATDHPHPAPTGPDHVDAAELDAAERAVTLARGRLEEARGAHQSVLAEVNTLRGALGGQVAEAIEQHVAAAALRVEASRSAAAQLPAVHDEQVALEAEAGTLAARRVELADRIASDRERHKFDAGTLDIDRRVLASGGAGFASVRARDDALRRRWDSLTELNTAQEALTTATATCADRQSFLDREMVRAGFIDASDLRAALLPPQERASMKAETAAHAEALLRVQGALANPDLLDIDPDDDLDTESAEAALQEAEAADRDARRMLDSRRDQAARLTSSWRRVEEALAESDRVIAKTDPQIRVADLISPTGRVGPNRLNIALSTYVLFRRFDNVVDAANIRLSDMSDGQYTLRVVDDQKVGGERRIGLGLEVVDARTGQSRPPSSLSGGETFYTSLSLALGLADIVQAQNGGITMDTLFVDEGFGSLDSETLDKVMNVLTGLRAADRVVGVISHVDEMKLRIGDRVEVMRASPEGPSILRQR